MKTQGDPECRWPGLPQLHPVRTTWHPIYPCTTTIAQHTTAITRNGPAGCAFPTTMDPPKRQDEWHNTTGHPMPLRGGQRRQYHQDTKARRQQRRGPCRPAQPRCRCVYLKRGGQSWTRWYHQSQTNWTARHQCAFRGPGWRNNQDRTQDLD